MPSAKAARIHERYALFEEIAAGGMATVHLGRLLGPVGFSRTVAIKRLLPQFASSVQFRNMFVDEARLAARVRHPNVVQTLDVISGEQELFLVMDYVHGESLSRLLKSCALDSLPSPVIVATVMAGILHGLHAAHVATNESGTPLGIIHRDVSPQNILVGVDGIARVLDFGIAKAVGRLHTTREGGVKGKLSYMAPEQLEGSPTQRTDVYAASVVLWEALTGTRLFTGDTDRAIIKRILSPDIDPPGMLRPGLPEALDDVVMTGLARNPADRFPSAREMALALERCLGVAPSSEVGAWVEVTRGEALRRRAAMVARIEEVSSYPSLRTVPAALLDTIVDARPPSMPELIGHPEVPTDTSAVKDRKPSARVRIGVAIVAAAAMGGAGLALGLALGREPQTAPAASAPVPSASTRTPPPSATPTVTLSPALSVTAPIIRR